MDSNQSPLDVVEKGPGSIAPLWAKLWPFKEDNGKKHKHFQMHISEAWSGALEKFKSHRSSVWHLLAIEKGPRSIGPQGTELWSFKDGNRSDLVWSFAKI